MSEISKVSIAVEIGGKPYFVNLPLDRMLMLMQLGSSLSDSGKLPVVAAPDGYRFTALDFTARDKEGSVSHLAAGEAA